MNFSGEITPAIQCKFRALYCKRKPMYPIIYCIVGMLMLTMGLLQLVELGRLHTVAFGVTMLLFGCVSLLMAFCLPQIWWRWWWPQFLRVFGTQLAGEVTAAGLRPTQDTSVITWRHVVAAKHTDSLLLLYLNKVSAYPIHKSMTKTESDWAELVILVKKNVLYRLD